ncbi:hypothetical protein [Desulfobulbus elongatus]|uniref:hypothetical protein n=1 Tax=Desulfobulbus elongatus TaxID=53332 RepID=UPI00146FBD2E|nr:hypothetical protein [Desulfobulbus elongatus]
MKHLFIAHFSLPYGEKIKKRTEAEFTVRSENYNKFFPKNEFPCKRTPAYLKSSRSPSGEDTPFSKQEKVLLSWTTPHPARQPASST